MTYQRIPKASEISTVELLIAPDGGLFAKVTFVDGDVQLLPTSELHHRAHRMLDWSMYLESVEGDAINAQGKHHEALG